LGFFSIASYASSTPRLEPMEKKARARSGEIISIGYKSIVSFINFLLKKFLVLKYMF